jgi:hypothetical protein
VVGHGDRTRSSIGGRHGGPTPLTRRRSVLVDTGPTRPTRSSDTVTVDTADPVVDTADPRWSARSSDTVSGPRPVVASVVDTVNRPGRRSSVGGRLGDRRRPVYVDPGDSTRRPTAVDRSSIGAPDTGPTHPPTRSSIRCSTGVPTRSRPGPSDTGPTRARPAGLAGARHGHRARVRARSSARVLGHGDRHRPYRWSALGARHGHRPRRPVVDRASTGHRTTGPVVGPCSTRSTARPTRSGAPPVLDTVTERPDPVGRHVNRHGRRGRSAGARHGDRACRPPVLDTVIPSRPPVRSSAGVDTGHRRGTDAVVGPVLGTRSPARSAVVGPVLDTVTGTAAGVSCRCSTRSPARPTRSSPGARHGDRHGLRGLGCRSGASLVGRSPVARQPARPPLGYHHREAQERPTQSVSAGSGGPPAVQPAQAGRTTAPGFPAPQTARWAESRQSDARARIRPDPALAPTRDTPATVGSRLAAFARSSLVGSSIFTRLRSRRSAAPRFSPRSRSACGDGSPVRPRLGTAELPALPSAPSGAASASRARRCLDGALRTSNSRLPR